MAHRHPQTPVMIPQPNQVWLALEPVALRDRWLIAASTASPGPRTVRWQRLRLLQQTRQPHQATDLGRQRCLAQPAPPAPGALHLAARRLRDLHPGSSAMAMADHGCRLATTECDSPRALAGLKPQDGAQKSTQNRPRMQHKTTIKQLYL